VDEIELEGYKTCYTCHRRVRASYERYRDAEIQKRVAANVAVA